MFQSNKIRIKSKIKVSLLIICLFLTGCGKKEDAAQGETTDIFSSYTISPSGALKNNGEHYLLFYDKASNHTVYLCNRAGCRHMDHDCGAYFENMKEAFFYNDHLYIVTSLPTGNCQIFRADRYGENREFLADIPMPVLQQEIIGNEYYFFAPVMEKSEDGSSHSVGQLLCRLNLDTGDYIEFPNIDTGYPNASPGCFTVTEDSIYLNYTASSIDINDFFDFDIGELQDITWDEIVQTDLLYRMNPDTKEAELICTRETTGAHFGIRVLEEQAHALILFSPDRILKYDTKTEGKIVLYTPENEIGMVDQLGEYYLIYDYSNSQFRLLKDWQEIASFSGLDHDIDSYFGISGDSVYFGRKGSLCVIKYEDLINGIYHFQVIDL